MRNNLLKIEVVAVCMVVLYYATFTDPVVI